MIAPFVVAPGNRNEAPLLRQALPEVMRIVREVAWISAAPSSVRMVSTNWLRDKYNRPIPGADLLVSNPYNDLMPLVTDVKDLGSGVIGGVECDHFAFRNKEVDWQIWIAQGARPHPCQYVITSKGVADAPQYSITIRDWKTGSEVTSDDFSFKAPADARKLELKELDTDELPRIFRIGGK